MCGIIFSKSVSNLQQGIELWAAGSQDWAGQEGLLREDMKIERSGRDGRDLRLRIDAAKSRKGGGSGDGGEVAAIGD